MVMEAVATDRKNLEEKKKNGPSRAMLRSILLSVLHVYDLWALGHDLLVIPIYRG